MGDTMIEPRPLEKKKEWSFPESAFIGMYKAGLALEIGAMILDAVEQQTFDNYGISKRDRKLFRQEIIDQIICEDWFPVGEKE